MNNGESRRNFLKKMAGAGAVAFALPIYKVSAAPSDRIPIIICNRGEQSGEKTINAGWEILSTGGKALDAAEKSANIAELDSDEMSVGFGGLPNEAGQVQLDAAVMNGATHQCGAVAMLEHIKTPSSVARLVMERTNHVMLTGQYALTFALAYGFHKDDLLTDRARGEWLRWKENLSEKDEWLLSAEGVYQQPPRLSGTLNVLAVDLQGNIAGIASSSGRAFQIPGRVGESAIIGAGLYVDNEVGGAAASGYGEEIIRTCGSFLVVEAMRQGMSPQKACEEACLRIIRINGGNERIKQLGWNVLFCAVSKNGDVGCSSLRSIEQKTPQISLIDDTGFHVYNGTTIII